MASRAKRLSGNIDLLPFFPPEDPELDALIKAMVAEADADPRPDVPMAEVFDGLRKQFAEGDFG